MTPSPSAKFTFGSLALLGALIVLPGCPGALEEPIDSYGGAPGGMPTGTGGNTNIIPPGSGGSANVVPVGTGGAATGGTGTGGRGTGGAGTGGAGTGGRGTGGAGTGGRGTGGAATGGRGTGGAATGGSGVGGTTATTWTEVYTTLFNNTAYASNCAGAACHNPGTQKNFNLATKATGYTSARAIVTPGSPTAGILFRELNTGAMPETRPKMPAADLAKVQSWISAGALDN